MTKKTRRSSRKAMQQRARMNGSRKSQAAAVAIVILEGRKVEVPNRAKKRATAHERRAESSLSTRQEAVRKRQLRLVSARRVLSKIRTETKRLMRIAEGR